MVSVLEAAIDRSASSACQSSPQESRPSDAELSRAFDAAKEPHVLKSLISRLYPEGTPSPEIFFERLDHLEFELGHSDSAKAIGLLLAGAAFESLDQSERVSLLKALNIGDSRALFVKLQYLAGFLQYAEIHHKHIAETLLEIEQNLKKPQGPFDRAIELFCRTRPDTAFATVSFLLLKHRSPARLRIAAFMLGLLRALTQSGETATSLLHLDGLLSRSPQEELRIAYMRSWIATGWQQAIPAEVVSRVTSAFSSEMLDERTAAFEVVSAFIRLPHNSPARIQEIADWLKEKATPTLENQCKSALIVMIGYAALSGASYLHQIAPFWLQILPVDDEAQEYWSNVADALHLLSSRQPQLFEQIFYEIAQHSGRKLKSILKKGDTDDHQAALVLHDMASLQAWPLVSRLLFSRSRQARKLGIWIFGKLGMSAIEKSHLENADEASLLVLLLETRIFQRYGPESAHLLLSLLSQVDRCGEEFRRELSEDLQILGKNLPGEALDAYKAVSDPHPLLIEVQKKVETYFDDLGAAAKCPAIQMEIPGFLQADRLQARSFSRQISEHLKKFSLLRFLAPSEVVLIYGKNMSTYSNGVLGPTSSLPLHSHSQEWPRLEFLCPEFQAVRRLFALGRVKELEEQRSQ